MADIQKTRALFEIRAIDKETDEVVYSKEVVADGEKEALFESDLKEVLKAKNLRKEDVTIITREFGQVPVREKAKIVKFLGQAGSFILGKESTN